MVATSACAGVSPTPAMKETTASFYGEYLAAQPRGVPSDEQQRQLGSHCSGRLKGLLKEASMAEERYAAATKGEVPPLVEGDLFTSLFEGARAFQVVLCEAKEHSCTVEFRYSEPSDPQPTVWKDKVFLVKESGRWLVDDIEFLGNWEFMHKGRLGELLSQVVRVSQAPRAREQ